jgi:hypothetical protein
MTKEKLMGAVKDLFYDIESMFIEGYSAKAISVQLSIPIRQVYDVLDTFGVAEDDMDVAEKPQEDLY